MNEQDFTKPSPWQRLREDHEKRQKFLEQVLVQSLEFTKKCELAYAEKQHGENYTYEHRKGTRVNLHSLNSNQRVCASQIKGHHILMTEKD